MTIEMIRREIEQDANARIDGWREIDLERRTFDDVNAVRRGRLKREHGYADIAAKLNVATSLPQHMRDQGRRR